MNLNNQNNHNDGQNKPLTETFEEGFTMRETDPDMSGGCNKTFAQIVTASSVVVSVGTALVGLWILISAFISGVGLKGVVIVGALLMFGISVASIWALLRFRQLFKY